MISGETETGAVAWFSRATVPIVKDVYTVNKHPFPRLKWPGVLHKKRRWNIFGKFQVLFSGFAEIFVQYFVFVWMLLIYGGGCGLFHTRFISESHCVWRCVPFVISFALLVCMPISRPSLHCKMGLIIRDNRSH